MKPLSLKESLELDKIDKKVDLAAANRDAARDLLLKMMNSLPRTPLSESTRMSDLLLKLKNTIP